MNYQYHMIARIDDTCQIKMTNLKIHTNFNFALKVKLNWSKNVREHRDAPWQTVLPSADQQYCLHLSTALWLEMFLDVSPNALTFRVQFYVQVVLDHGVQASVSAGLVDVRSRESRRHLELYRVCVASSLERAGAPHNWEVEGSTLHPVLDGDCASVFA